MSPHRRFKSTHLSEESDHTQSFRSITISMMILRSKVIYELIIIIHVSNFQLLRICVIIPINSMDDSEALNNIDPNRNKIQLY